MKSSQELKTDLFVLRTIRQSREQNLLIDLFSPKGFNEELFRVIQENQWADKETEKYL